MVLLTDWLNSLSPGDTVYTNKSHDPAWIVVRADGNVKPPKLHLKHPTTHLLRSVWGQGLHNAKHNTLPRRPLQRQPEPDALTAFEYELPPPPDPRSYLPAPLTLPSGDPGYDVEWPEPLPPGHDRITACVYRLFNDQDVLVYVGSGYDPRKRFKVHRNGSQSEPAKSWWRLIHHYTITWYPNRMLADLAEHTAIVHEEPLINQAGKKRFRYQPSHVRKRYPDPA